MYNVLLQKVYLTVRSSIIGTLFELPKLDLGSLGVQLCAYVGMEGMGRGVRKRPLEKVKILVLNGFNGFSVAPYGLMVTE